MSRVAYLINQYPKVSHSFIRREILALERQGFDILRIALRGWDAILVDEEDRRERIQTRFVLLGVWALAWSTIWTACSGPIRFFRALRLALRMGVSAERPLPYHLLYLAEACRILPWLKSHGATHLHAHFCTNSTEVAMLARTLGGPPYSFTVHGTSEFDRLQKLGIDEKVRRAAFVVAVCAYGRSQLYRRLQFELWPRIHVVHCGLEAAFHEVEPAIAHRQRLVCVGRLSAEKGQMLLVEAAYRLSQAGFKFELVLAGDGEMRKELETLILRCGLQERIRITGWISSNQVREEILAACALVQPSFSEGLPVVVMEAMALRRPVLTTFVGGIPELVRSGETGWLFPAGDVAELTIAIEACLSTPTAVLADMGEAAYRRVVTRHSIDTEAGKLAALIRGATSIAA